jgi:hypothetical protein
MSLIKEIAKRGYVVNWMVTPQPGGKGENFLFQMVVNEKKAVFSNNKMHESTAVFGKVITNQNTNDIIGKIIVGI